MSATALPAEVPLNEGAKLWPPGSCLVVPAHRPEVLTEPHSDRTPSRSPPGKPRRTAGAGRTAVRRRHREGQR